MSRITILSISVLLIISLIPINAVFQESAKAEIPIGKSSGSNNHTIKIIGNGGFNSTNNVTSGSGTLNDPFIIRDLYINASNGPGFIIYNTTAHFRIINITVHSGNWSEK